MTRSVRRLAAGVRRRLVQASAVARVALAALGVEATLRLLTLPAAARVAGVGLRLDGGEDGDPCRELRLTQQESRDLELALRVLRRGPVDDSCLRRSLLIGHLLRRRGPVLRIGVAKRDGQVRAHAWLVVEGASLDGGRPDGYAELATVRTEALRA